MLLLVLLLLPSLSLSTLLGQGVSTPASPTSSFEGIKDPITKCIDIPCYRVIFLTGPPLNLLSVGW